MAADAQQETLDFLLAREPRGKIVSTHISHVVLGRDRVYKLKRAVAFPYLDFSTADKRLAMCAREFELNSRAAPTLYLGARRVTREADGALALDGAGALVDAVVEMRRFCDADLFETMAQEGRLTGALVDALANKLARFHDEAAVCSVGGFAKMRDVLALARQSLAQAPPAPQADIDAHSAALASLLERDGALLDARHARGATRRCHGDLTLRNICLFEGEPTPFDCIEFSEDLASIDVLYDLSFLLMDLWRVEQQGFANLAFNRYLDARDETDGLPLLPLFMSLRAAIRAYVAAAQEKRAEAQGYFALSQALARENAGLVIAIGGLSGSGKSSVATRLAAHVGAAPGARGIASDRLRKKLFGVDPLVRLPAAAYERDVSARVYAGMCEEAKRVASLGWPVVVDAVFDLPQSRAEIESVAKDAGVPFFGFWLDVDLEERLKRVGARRDDPSDATAAVLLEQARRDAGDIAWSRIDAAGDPGRAASAVLSAISF